MNDVGLRRPGRRNRVTFLGFLVLVLRRGRFVGVSTVVAAVLATAFALSTALMPPGSRHNPLPDRYSPQAEVMIMPSQNAALSSTLGNVSSASSSALNALSGSASGSSGTGLSALLQSTSAGGATVEETSTFAEAVLKGDALADMVTSHFDFAKRYGIRRDVKTRSRSLFRKSISSKYDPKSGILTITYTNTDRVFATDVLTYTLDALQKRLSDLSAGKAVDTRDYLQGRVAQAKTSLDEARAQLISFEKVHGIVNLQQQAQVQAAQIASLESRIQSDQTQLKALAQYPALKDQARVTQLNIDIAVSKNLLNDLRAGTSSFNINAIPENQIPTISVEYANLSLEVSIRSSIYSSLRKDYESARLQANGASAWFQVIQDPQVPEVKSGPHRVALTILIVAVVFVIAVIISLVSGRIEEQQAARSARRTRSAP